MSDDAWIQQSLTRLETLEAQKEQHEAAGYAVPTEIAAEISALYETLEAVASSEEGAAPMDGAAASQAAAIGGPFEQPTPGWGAPAGAPQAEAPMAAPQYGAAPGAAAPYGEPSMGDPSTVDYSSMGDDVDMPKSKAPIILGLLVAVVAVGGGGAYFVSQQHKAEPPAAPAGEAKVIGASEIPEDTQEPKVAEGADVARTPLQEIPDGPDRRRGSHRGGGKKRGGGGGSKSKSDNGRKVKIADDSRDPLAGLK